MQVAARFFEQYANDFLQSGDGRSARDHFLLSVSGIERCVLPDRKMVRCATPINAEASGHQQIDADDDAAPFAQLTGIRSRRIGFKAGKPLAPATAYAVF